MAELKKYKILLVEDSAEQALLTSRWLRQQLDAQVMLAPTGADAIEQLAHERFDLMLCDFDLPDVRGVDVVRRAKVLAPDMPSIVVTAHQSVETVVGALRSGANDFLSKPLSKFFLLSRVQAHLQVQPA